MPCNDINSLEQCKEFQCANISYCKQAKEMGYTDEKKGMTLHEMKDHLEESMKNRPFGLTWNKIEEIQGAKIK